MGNWNSGRRPQPTKIKLLRGKVNPDRVTRHEPQPHAATSAFDTPPDDLLEDPVGLAEWRRLAPMLRVCGLVSEAERSSLLALCQQWSRYLEAQRKVRTLGMIVKTASGVPVVNPYMAVGDKALLHCHKLWNELGLTPSGRARMTALVTADMPHKESKWAGLL